jgi:hypothetical protein
MTTGVSEGNRAILAGCLTGGLLPSESALKAQTPLNRGPTRPDHLEVLLQKTPFLGLTVAILLRRKKIPGKKVSPYATIVSAQIGRKKRHRCINEICKRAHIVYRGHEKEIQAAVKRRSSASLRRSCLSSVVASGHCFLVGGAGGVVTALSEHPSLATCYDQVIGICASSRAGITASPQDSRQVKS